MKMTNFDMQNESTGVRELSVQEMDTVGGGFWFMPFLIAKLVVKIVAFGATAAVHAAKN